MGGCLFEEDDCKVNYPKTLVLVGKTGNGKSATGNSILGMQIFKSKRSSSGVTITSEMQATTLNDGQIINMIDTPGLFDSCSDFEFIGKEIAKCISMATDGIHAFLVVISIRNCFSEDERAAISSLLNLFGRKIYDYMIIVFTGGDDLEEDQSLEDFICESQALEDTLELCGNRYVLFDNKTKDENKRSNQVDELFSLVKLVSIKNGGKPYTSELFAEFKKCTREPDQHEDQFYGDGAKTIYELIESKFKDISLKLERHLAEERDAREKAEKKAEASREKADELNRKMQESLEKAEKRNEELPREREEERRKRPTQMDLSEELQRKWEEERQKEETYWRQRGEGWQMEEDLCRQMESWPEKMDHLRRQMKRLRQMDEDLRRQAARDGCFIL